MLWSVIRLIFKTSSVTPDFFYVFNLVLSFSTCSQSFNKICVWEVLGANVLKTWNNKYLLTCTSWTPSHTPIRSSTASMMLQTTLLNTSTKTQPRAWFFFYPARRWKTLKVLKMFSHVPRWFPPSLFLVSLCSRFRTVNRKSNPSNPGSTWFWTSGILTDDFRVLRQLFDCKAEFLLKGAQIKICCVGVNALPDHWNRDKTLNMTKKVVQCKLRQTSTNLN